MEKEEEFDLILLSLYQAKTPEKIQELINKNVPMLLKSINAKSPTEQKKVVKAVNDFIVFIKGHTSVQLPLNELVDLMDSKIILQKNITAIFLKIGIERAPTNQLVPVLINLMNKFPNIPTSIQQMIFSLYLKNNSNIDSNVFMYAIQKNQSYLLNMSDADLKSMVPFVKNHYSCFSNNANLFLFFALKFDEIDNTDFSKFNSKSIINGILPNFENFKPEERNRALRILTFISEQFPIDKIIQNLNLENAYPCLEHQLNISPPGVIQPFLRQISQSILTSINHFIPSSRNMNIMETYLSCLRTLLKKCYLSYSKDYSFFKSIFKNHKISNEQKNSILYLFSSFIVPSDSLLKFLENQAYDGESIALTLMRQIYTFDEPKTKVIACTLMTDQNFSDECRQILHPYSFSYTNGFRYTIMNDKAEPPLISSLFDVIISDKQFFNFFLQSSNTRNVSTLFNFACICTPAYPLPYDFIVKCLRSCPNSAQEISQFLVYISENLPIDNTFDPHNFIDYIITESDPSIVDSISKFLSWSKCSINVEEIASKLNGHCKVAFLSYFTDQFDEAFGLLTTSGRSNLGKNCLMAMAKRGILNETHFNKLYPIISNDSIGIEILSEIASTNEELCKRLTQKLFEPPFLTSERIEIIVIAARKLTKIVSEDFIMDLIDTGMKSEKSRRNSSIFLLYLINTLQKEPKRLWFVTRTLLFCSSSENGIVRIVGEIGLNILYLKSDHKTEIESAILGKNKPENETVQYLTGQPRSQFVMNLLKMSKDVKSFINLLLILIEPEYLIFNGIDIPTPKVENIETYSSKFYYYSFSPNETTSKNFRTLWKYSTDGGKKLIISDIINVIDYEQNEWEIQQQNINCIYDIITRITNEQLNIYFEKLSIIVIKIIFSPVEEISLLGVKLLDKIFQKFDKKIINNNLQHLILDIINQLFDTRKLSLVKLSIKWTNEFLPILTDINDILVLFNSLFNGLSLNININDMITSDIWNVYTNLVFKCVDINLKEFFNMVIKLMNTMIILDSQRFAIFYAYDTLIRSTKRMLICDEIEGLIPKIFTYIKIEKNENIIKLISNIITHSINCIYYVKEEIYEYDSLIFDLYFNEEKFEIVGLILKQINSNNCLRSTMSPLILFASCSDDNIKEYKILLRDDIPITIEINSSPNKFIDFCFKYGIEAQKNIFRSIGCKCLLKIVENLKEDILRTMKQLFDKVIPLIDGRLYPYKENLIDVITLMIPLIDDLNENDFVPIIEKQLMRQKSVFRAAAFNCIVEINKKFNINKENLINAMIDAVNNGNFIAIKASFNCVKIISDNDLFQSYVNACYRRLENIECENLDELCKMILMLPAHKTPKFDMEKLKNYANMNNPMPNVKKLFDTLK